MTRPEKKRALVVSTCNDGKTSVWLTVLPLVSLHFHLSATEFRDALSMRYQRPLLTTPSVMDVVLFFILSMHAWDCKKGDLVTQHHNEVRDALGRGGEGREGVGGRDLASTVFNNVL